MYMYILIYVYIYTYTFIVKTPHVTAVSKGDGMMLEQVGNKGIGRNHQDPRDLEAMGGLKTDSSSLCSIGLGVVVRV